MCCVAPWHIYGCEKVGEDAAAQLQWPTPLLISLQAHTCTVIAMPARRCLARPQISYECTRPHARPARAGFMSMSMNKNTYTPFWYLHSVLGPTHVLTTSIQCTSGAKVHLLFTIYKVSMFFACLFSTFIHFWLPPHRNFTLVSVPKFCYQLAKADAMLVALAPLECWSPMRQQ